MGNMMVWKQHFYLLEDIVDKIGVVLYNSKAIFHYIKSMVAMDGIRNSFCFQKKKTYLLWK